MTEATTAEIAWAAGLFEGEGCFSGNGKNIMVSLAMTDRDAVERFCSIVGMGKVVPKTQPQAKPHWKAQWQWYINSYTQLEILASALEPWLCERRKLKLEELRARRTEFLSRILRERPCAGCSRLFQPESVTRSRNRRYCTASCRVSAARTRRIAACVS